MSDLATMVDRNDQYVRILNMFATIAYPGRSDDSWGDMQLRGYVACFTSCSLVDPVAAYAFVEAIVVVRLLRNYRIPLVSIGCLEDPYGRPLRCHLCRVVLHIPEGNIELLRVARMWPMCRAFFPLPSPVSHSR